MFKNFSGLTVVICALVTPLAVAADTKYYVGGNLGGLRYTEELDPLVQGEDASAGLPILYARLGVQPHENFSSELRLGVGLGEGTDDITVGGTTVEVDLELEHFWGLYVRGGVQLGRLFYPYLIAGYTRGELTARAEAGNIRVSISDTASDFSYGVGTDIRLSETIHANLEVMNYFDSGSVEVIGGTIGISWSF